LFKQKTAYEIFTCLEFRRVLFRSLEQDAGDARAHLHLADAAQLRDILERQRQLLRVHFQIGDGNRRRRSFRRGRLLAPGAEGSRSEERRVGKEGETRWTVEHEIIE